MARRLRCLLGRHVYRPWHSYGSCGPGCTDDHQLRFCRFCPKAQHRFRPPKEDT